ncbi:Similar to Putative ankyrin repeat protein MM_0045; acc. no. Q8Q0U0 [Pyronema omphalodes CBS 100304]|uniref:Similar to Putative ankyrin repeat protein MM_0045 acc. no. Q8Q0U0 n=1 Tax=Pyronema omphalodes (strain CBS 100304) TaxID=1076935 RepID=U4L589_PYROM|nr:Similar to Putative ankyrin repeat protein MM_0045; acc. no. Q8Q0U0 [Pyronema omphalodes CBS 100304]
MWAAQRGHEVVVQLQLDKDIDMHSKDYFGKGVLSFAVESGDEAVVRIIIEKGADIEAKNNSGETPLSYAARVEYVTPVVKLLLDKGAEVNSPSCIGKTPLMLAAEDGAEDNMQLLLERGADSEATDDIGHTVWYHMWLHLRSEILDDENHPLSSLYREPAPEFPDSQNNNYWPR